jgi:hypothetical protein
LSPVSVVSQVEVSASGSSLVQRSPTECDVSECDHESSIMSRPWPTGAVAPRSKKFTLNILAALESDLILLYT